MNKSALKANYLKAWVKTTYPNMKKRQALVWIIWGTMPLLSAFIPVFRAWDIFVTPSFGQNIQQNHAIEQPGFWDKFRSALNNPESNDTKSDTEQIKLVLDSIYGDEIRFYDSLPHFGFSDWDRCQNINTFKNKKTNCNRPQALLYLALLR